VEQVEKLTRRIEEGECEGKLEVAALRKRHKPDPKSLNESETRITAGLLMSES